MFERMVKAAAVAALLLAGCGDDGGGRPADDWDGGGGGGPGSDAAVGGGDGAPDEVVTVTITEPADGALLRNRRVRVTGAYTGHPAAVRIDDTAATLGDGTFEGTLELEPGTHTIVVTAGEARAEVGVTVDPTPPRLEITAPARGTHQTERTLALRFRCEDDNGLASLTLNGASLDTGAGPDFEVPLTLDRGLNVLRLEATDAAGNLAREHVSVLQGPLRSTDDGVPSALRMHVGPDGLDGIARTARDLLDVQDLAELIPLDGLRLGDGTFGVTLGAIDYEKPSTVELVPEAGRLRFHLQLDHFTVELHLQIGDRSVYVVGVGARALRASGALIPGIDGEGRLTTDLDDLDLAFEGFAIEFGDIPEFRDNPGALQTLIEEMLSGGLSAVAEQRLPALLDDFLGRLAEPIDLELLDTALRIQLRPDVVVVGAAGLSARVDAGVVLVDPPMAPADLPGFLGSPSDWDGVPQTTQLGLALDDDLLNLLVFQLWRSGKLFPTIDQALVDEGRTELRLVTTLLGNLIRRARPDVAANTPLRVETELPLPPVAAFVEADDGVGITVGVGDLDVLIETDDASRRDLLQGVASLLALGTASVKLEDGQAPEIAVTIDEMVTAFDVTDADLRGEIEASVEGPVLEILGSLGGALSGLLSGIPLPTLEGLTLSDVRLGVTGPSGDFLQATATLGAE